MSCPLVWALQPCYSFSASTLTTKRLWFDTRKSSLSSFSLFFSFISILRLRARPPARFSGSRAPVPRSSGPGWRAWSSSPRRPATNKALEKVLIYCYIFLKQSYYNQTELNNVSWEVNCLYDRWAKHFNKMFKLTQHAFKRQHGVCNLKLPLTWNQI